MAFGNRSARRRGMVVGAALASSRAKKKEVASQQPQTQPAKAASASDIEKLKQLAELRDQGILTEEEFTAKKKQILGI